jgi:hypothetical protein
MQSIILSFQACLTILFTIVNSSPTLFPIVNSRQASGLITAAFFDVNQKLITEFEVGIALQQDLSKFLISLCFKFSFYYLNMQFPFIYIHKFV